MRNSNIHHTTEAPVFISHLLDEHLGDNGVLLRHRVQLLLLLLLLVVLIRVNVPV